MLAFTVFHIGLRVSLGLGAVLAGGIADVIGEIDGIDPIRVVMVGAGLVVLVATVSARTRLGDI